MENFIRSVVYQLMKVSLFRWIAGFFISLGGLLKKQLQRVINEKKETIRTNIYNKFFVNNLVVQAGPFRGLRYPTFQSFGSTTIPKFIGSYEEELHEIVEEIISKEHSEIINIGCAEGYYTVGLAMRKPTSKTYAFDIDKKALSFCKEMAELNDVIENITFGVFCDDDYLKNFNFSGPGLIICDVEGYEYDLFTEENVSNLSTCDILIELHDFHNKDISPKMRRVFETTHNLKFISNRTRHESDYKDLLPGISARDRQMAVNERILGQQWLYLTPK